MVRADQTRVDSSRTATRRLAGVAVVHGRAPSAALAAQQASQAWTSADAIALKRAGDVQFSPDGTRVAYTVLSSQRSGRPTSQIWIYDVAEGHALRAWAATATRGRTRAGRPTAGRSPSPAGSTTSRGWPSQRMDDSPPLFLTRVVGIESPAAVAPASCSRGRRAAPASPS